MTGAALTVMLVAASASPAQGQSKDLCLRPARQASCASYLLFEMRGRGHLVDTDREIQILRTLVHEDGSVEELTDTRRRQELGVGASVAMAPSPPPTPGAWNTRSPSAEGSRGCRGCWPRWPSWLWLAPSAET